jgi:threonylcarbamoyladenosine tRNA methylthiotransferase MtaB
MRTIAFHNLGCKVNSYETDAMAQKCIEKGYKTVDFEQKADIYVVNTCSVTNIADRKSRQMLHKAKKQNPDSVVVAVGCFVQANPEEVAKDDAIDLIVGNNKKKDLFEILEEYLSKKAIPTEKIITDVHHCDYEELKINKSEEHSRVFVKIQDGCDRYCTYCIIPYVRGNLRSRKPEDVVSEIKEIATNGYREVVITGIHLSSYGKDFLKDGKPSLDYTVNSEYLINLLKDINDIEGIDRIRIGSFEPMILSEDFVSKLSKISKLCPHFHISLQSGCDSVLKRMNRHYDTKAFYEKTVLLRKYFPGCALTTDVIVGFPGETEDEFETTYKYLTKIKFFETHIFPYSRRKGTVADKMPNQLTMNEKKERVSRLLELDAKLSKEYRESKLGDTDNIIVEEIKTINGANYFVGHTPEYVMVALKEDDSISKLIGHTVKVKLDKMLTDEVVLGFIEQ